MRWFITNNSKDELEPYLSRSISHIKKEDLESKIILDQTAQEHKRYQDYINTYGEIRKTIPVTPSYPPCKGCGQTAEYSVTVGGMTFEFAGKENRFCGECATKMVASWVKGITPEDSRVHCKVCSFHIKACICPESTQMKDLKG